MTTDRERQTEANYGEDTSEALAGLRDTMRMLYRDYERAFDDKVRRLVRDEMAMRGGDAVERDNPLARLADSAERIATALEAISGKAVPLVMRHDEPEFRTVTTGGDLPDKGANDD